MISIVVATYDQVQKLDRCIRTLRETHRGDADYEVIVVLDGGPFVAETRAVAEKYGAKFVHLPENSGCGYANNAGIKAASPESSCVIVVNDDVWFEEAACFQIARFLEDNPRVGIVGARLLYPDGTVQHAGLDARILHIGRNLPRDHALVVDARIVVAVTSALMGISKRLLDEIVGFDPRYRMGYEDIDICFRARECLWLIHYIGSTWAFHDEGGTRGKSEELGANVVWSGWNGLGHKVFFDTWSSSQEVFCYDSVTFVVAATGKKLLADALQSIARQLSGRDEVVVVDSGENRETRALVDGLGQSFRYYAQPTGSLAEQLNFGLKRASGCSIACLLEGDMYDDGALALIKQEIRRNPLKPMLFRVRRTAGLDRIVPQMILIPNCPDFTPAWNPAVDFDSEAAALFVSEVSAKYPGNPSLKTDIVIA